MLYLITSATGLKSVYGQNGYTLIQQKLEALTGVSGATLKLLDDAGSMQGLAPARSQDAASLREAWSPIGRQLGTQDYVAIIGDQRVIPSFSVPNPVTDRTIDPDTFVLTDNPFGEFRFAEPGDCTQPLLGIGRIAPGVSDSAQDVCSLLDWQITLRQQRPPRYGYVEVTSRQWQETSSFVLSALVSSQRVFVSPDSRITAGNAANLDCKYLYCNLHGFIDESAWMGYDQGLACPVPAITPDAFQSQYVSGTVVFSEACYGLAIDNKSKCSSCALSLLAAGVGAVVGSTGLAFGTATAKPQDLIDADAMARGFFNTALATSQGQTVGSCLRAARAALALTSSSADAFVKKTLLEFQILGDPSYAAS